MFSLVISDLLPCPHLTITDLNGYILKNVSDVGSPRCDAFPHDVCPEHGAHPVPPLAPQPRRTRAGPRTPAAPRCERQHARQLRTTDTGTSVKCGYHQEPNTKIIPTWKCAGEQCVQKTEFLFNNTWKITGPLHKKTKREWSKMKQKQLDSGHRVGSQLQPQANSWQISTVAALFLSVPPAILAGNQPSCGTSVI